MQSPHTRLLDGISLVRSLPIIFGCVASCSVVAHADCLDDAAAFHHVNVRLVRAIAQVESGMRPGATNVNADGSTDIGLMQINSSWLRTLARYGIREENLYDGCTNAYIGTWILSKNIRQLGLTWDAIGAYNAVSADKRIVYARKIYRQVMAASDSAPASVSILPTPNPAAARVSAKPPARAHQRRTEPVAQTLVAYEAQ